VLHQVDGALADDTKNSYLRGCSLLNRTFRRWLARPQVRRRSLCVDGFDFTGITVARRQGHLLNRRRLARPTATALGGFALGTLQGRQIGIRNTSVCRQESLNNIGPNDSPRANLDDLELAGVDELIDQSARDAHEAGGFCNAHGEWDSGRQRRGHYRHKCATANDGMDRVVDKGVDRRPGGCGDIGAHGCGGDSEKQSKKGENTG
jgi:hypothetical protein